MDKCIIKSIRATLRKWKFQIAVIASILFITLPYVFLYLPDTNNPIAITSDILVTEFTTNNCTKFQAIANAFDFQENSFNVTILPSIFLNNLQVFNANTLIFNGTGNLSIAGLNITLFSYVLESNATAKILGDRLMASSVPPDPWNPVPVPREDMELDFGDRSTSCQIYATNQESRQLLYFGAQSGNLVVLGDKQEVIPLANSYVSALMNVSIPVWGNVITTVSGNMSRLFLRDWERIDFLFDGEESSLVVGNPKGQIVFNDRTYETVSPFHYSFLNIFNRVHIVSSPDPNSYRVIVLGSVTSIKSSFGSTENELAQKQYFPDYLWSPFPFPVLLLGITLLAVTLFCFLFDLRKKRIQWQFVAMIAITTFSLGSVIWAVKTQQPIWVQNFWSFTPLFVNITIFLVGKRSGEEKKPE